MDSSPVGISTGMNNVNRNNKVEKENKNRKMNKRNKNKKIVKRNKNDIYYSCDVKNNRDEYKSSRSCIAEVDNGELQDKATKIDRDEFESSSRSKAEVGDLELHVKATDNGRDEFKSSKEFENQISNCNFIKDDDKELRKNATKNVFNEEEVFQNEIASELVSERTNINGINHLNLNIENEVVEKIEDERCTGFFIDEKEKKKKHVRFLEELTNSYNDENCSKLNTNENGNVARRALVSRSKEETKKVICTPNAEPDKTLEQSKAKSRGVEQNKFLNCNTEDSFDEFLKSEEEAILNWKKEYPSIDGKLIERNNLDISKSSNAKLIGNLVDTGWKESRRVFLEVFIREQPLRCGVDSMADVSLISFKTWKYLKEPPLKKSAMKLEDAQGNSFQALGEVQLNICINIDDYKFVLTKFNFIVVPELIVSCILGRDWMEYFEVSTKFGEDKSTITIGTTEIELIDEDHPESYPVILTEDIRLKANTRTLVAVQVVGVQEDTEGTIEPIQETPEGILLDPCINKINNKHVILCVWNTHNKEVYLPKGTIIGSWFHIEPSQVLSLRRRPEAAAFDKWLKEGAPIAPPSNELAPDEVETWVSDLWEENMSNTLSLKQKDQMLKVLHRRRQAFPSQGKLNECKLFDNVIQLDKEVKPLNQRQYPLPKDGEEAAKEAIHKLESAGIIEQMESPWNQPVLLVKKPSGGWRTVIDYRGLNKLIKQPISTPLPKIDDTLRALGGNLYYSCVDMTDGFFQLSLAPESVPLTCFTYQGISYCYTRMPQGCKSSPASFQLAMQLVLQGLQWNCCVIYLDDVLIFSKSFEQHLKDVEKVLVRFEKAGLTVKPKKCLWAQSSLDFLGHTINADGIKPKRENLQKLQEGKPPQTLRQLRGFLGMVGQYRKFIPGYSILAAPLEKLLRKDAPYDWKDKQQKAYLNLRDILNEQQQLAFPDYEKSFILTLDVTESCRSVLLSQIQDNKERRIGFASKKWKDYEMRYPPMEQAASTMLFGINKFKAECINQLVIVRTTCKELRWLLTNSKLQGRQAKWAVLMSHINYEIKIISDGKLEKLMSVNSLKKDPEDPAMVSTIQVAPPEIKLTGVDGTEENETLFLTFDGGSRSSKGISAYGWCLWYSNWNPIAAEGCFTQGRTNNDQEFMALYAGVKAALTYRPAKLNIFGDSELIIDQIHQRKETRTIPSEVYKKITLDLLNNIPQWNIIHVPRSYNRAADFLCNTAMDLRKDIQLNTRVWKQLTTLNLIPKWIKKHTTELICSIKTRSKTRNLESLKSELSEKIPAIQPSLEWEADQTVLQKIKVDQDRTPWMNQFKNCLKGLDAPDDTAEGIKLAKQLKDFVLFDDTLYRCKYPKSGVVSGYKKSKCRTETIYQLVVPENHRQNILKSYHAEPWGGHHGVTRTYEKISFRFFWFNMFQDVVNFIGNCLDCNTGKTHHRKQRTKLQRNIIPKRPFDVWGIDVVGPFTESMSGNKWIVVFVDHYSRWVEAFATKNHNADTVVDLLINEICSRYGTPRKILTDRGSEFLSSFARSIYKTLNVVKLNTTAYHPQSNGKVERMNKNVVQRLKMYVNEDHTDWDQFLPRVLWGIRADYNEATGFSPFKILYGKEMWLPADRVLNKITDNLLPIPKDKRQFIRELTMDLLWIRRKAELSMENSFLKNERNYNKSLEEVSYPEGTKVWLWIEPRATGLTRKLIHCWHGPFIVERQDGTNCHLIVENGVRIHKVVHINRLRECFNEWKKPLDPNNEFEVKDKLTLEDLPDDPEETDAEEKDDILLEVDEFEVEKILQSRQKRDKNTGRYQKEYLIKWTGYGEEENTWVMEEALSCPERLEEFEATKLSEGRMKKALKRH